MSQRPQNNPLTIANAIANTQMQQAKHVAPAALGMGALALAKGLHAPGRTSNALGLGAIARLGAGLQIPGQPALIPTWSYVVPRFSEFLQNITLTSTQLSDGERLFKGIVSCLNQAYYDTSSETDNAFYIGSWAKNTRVRPPRDVDLYFLLPVDVYHRFERYAAGSNKQSALLQEVKQKLASKYSRSELKGDGPVVYAGFNSFELEVVPAFRLNEDRAYWVPSTKNGGQYLKTMPLHEVDAIDVADKRNNFNVRTLVRMLKCWQANCSVPLRSYYLELLATKFLDQWQYSDQGLFYYDWMCRDFFAWVLTTVNTSIFAPGTYEMLWLGDAWKSRAESALLRAKKACDFERSSNNGDAGEEWQKIFGNNIPKWA